MLKPALVRGDFRVIGATTDEEYVRWVLGDPALERRFQKLAIRELGEAETLDILRARKERLERHHNVLITDEAIEAAVRLTDLHVTDRMRPDKALDALDEACAHMQALAVYSPRAEELIRRARDAARGRRGSTSEGRGPAPAPRPAPRSTSPSGDPLERFAQDGFSALEKFGAELEAMLVGAPTPVTGSRPTEPRPDAKSSEASADHPQSAVLPSELARQLMEEGIVVRGHDIARVVGLMTGQKLEW
jgi:ATP-dependent Clp protease ATP-binding subunit ClpA